VEGILLMSGPEVRYFSGYQEIISPPSQCLLQRGDVLIFDIFVFLNSSIHKHFYYNWLPIFRYWYDCEA